MVLSSSTLLPKRTCLGERNLTAHASCAIGSCCIIARHTDEENPMRKSTTIGQTDCHREAAAHRALPIQLQQQNFVYIILSDVEADSHANTLSAVSANAPQIT